MSSSCTRNTLIAITHMTITGVMDDLVEGFSPWQLVASEWGGYLKSYQIQQVILATAPASATS